MGPSRIPRSSEKKLIKTEVPQGVPHPLVSPWPPRLGGWRPSTMTTTTTCFQDKRSKIRPNRRSHGHLKHQEIVPHVVQRVPLHHGPRGQRFRENQAVSKHSKTMGRITISTRSTRASGPRRTTKDISGIMTTLLKADNRGHSKELNRWRCHYQSAACQKRVPCPAKK